MSLHKNGVLPAEVLVAAYQALDGYFGLPSTTANDNGEGRGGYLAVVQFDPDKLSSLIRRKLVVLGRCGEPSGLEGLQYQRFAQEKAKRLLEHLSVGHLTSRESADPAVDQYPGAILAGEYIVSFSGLRVDFDEAVSIAVAVLMDWLTREQLLTIIERTGNGHIQELGNMFKEFQELLTE